MKVRNSERNSRCGFTLVEVMVSSFLTLIVLGMLFSVLVGVLDAWEAGSSSLQSSGDARLAMDVLRTDLESLVARQTSFNQEWLFSEPYQEGGITFTRLAFFAPSLDRDPDQPGDVVALHYQVALQDPLSSDPESGPNPIFGLYKAMTSTEEAFNNVMDFGPEAFLVGDNGTPGYWTSSPTPSVRDPSGFLAQHVVGFKVTWLVRPLGGGNLVRASQNNFIRLSNTLRAWGPEGDDIWGGKIEGAEVTMTLLNDEGARQLAFFGEGDVRRRREIIRDHGRTHTMRVSIHY